MSKLILHDQAALRVQRIDAGKFEVALYGDDWGKSLPGDPWGCRCEVVLDRAELQAMIDWLSAALAAEK